MLLCEGWDFFNIKNKATNEYRNDFLQNDPDVVNYDKETEEVLKDVNELAELQEANDKKFHEISTQTQEAETQIIQKLRIAQKDEIEELGGLIDELENVKGEVELLKPLVETSCRSLAPIWAPAIPPNPRKIPAL